MYLVVIIYYLGTELPKSLQIAAAGMTTLTQSVRIQDAEEFKSFFLKTDLQTDSAVFVSKDYMMFWDTVDSIESTERETQSQISSGLFLGRRPIIQIVSNEDKGSTETLPSIGRVHAWCENSEESFDYWLKNIGEHFLQIKNRSAQLKALGSRNRELSTLKEKLEGIVNERTAHLQKAVSDVNTQSAEVRELVRFVKEISQVDSLDEVLTLIGYENRKFHQMRMPILCVASPEFGARVYFHQSKQPAVRGSSHASDRIWERKQVYQLWERRSKMGPANRTEQAYFAKILGRPITKMISFPLGSLRGQIEPLLVFEHDLELDDVDRINKFWRERIEAVSMGIDRILLNQELFGTSRLWRKIFDSIPDPVAVVSDSGLALRWNAAYRESDKDVSSRAIPRDLCHQIFANRDEPCEGCIRFDKREDGSERRSWDARRDGKVFRVTEYPLEVESGLMVLHYEDVTKFKEVRAHAIQGEKLAAIGRMAGNIAHELNNPLAGIRSLAQVLAKFDSLTPSLKKDLSEVERASVRSSQVIKDLMDFAASDVHDTRWIGLNEIISSAMNMLKTALHDHQVHLELQASEKVEVFVEPHLLQQVIFNIINNATQAMREPGQILIETQVQQGLLTIKIADSGPGIPAEIRSRIFEPFFTTKPAGQGTGLGLSLSRWIVESFGGELSVSNRPTASGALFSIQLRCRS